MKIALICIASIIVIPAIIYGTACVVDAIIENQLLQNAYLSISRKLHLVKRMNLV